MKADARELKASANATHDPEGAECAVDLDPAMAGQLDRRGVLGDTQKSNIPQGHKTTTPTQRDARTGWRSDCRVILDSAAIVWVSAGRP